MTTVPQTLRSMVFGAALLTLGIAQQAPAAICLNCPPPIPPPPPPPVVVSLPDFVFQTTSCPDQKELDSMKATLTTALKVAEQALDLQLDDPPPDPEVHAVCVQGIATVGAWLFPVGYLGAWDNNTSRNAGWALNDTVRQPGEAFGLRVTKEGINRLLDIAWRDQVRTLDTNGNYDPNGSIHLVSFGSSFYDSIAYFPWIKLVDTRVTGYYSGPFTQTNFYGGVADYLWLTPVVVNPSLTVGQIVCSSDPEWHMDTTIETVLATVFGVLHNVDQMVGQIANDGPACRLTRMLPLQVLFGQSGKLMFDYTRFHVDTKGITAGGALKFASRAPVLTINGPSPLVVEYGDPATATYTLDVTDMRPPYKVTWTANGVTQTNTSYSPSLTVTWNLGNAKPVSYLSRTITATVVDADANAASVSRTVSIKLQWDADLPPICHIHPYLPECDIY